MCVSRACRECGGGIEPKAGGGRKRIHCAACRRKILEPRICPECGKRFTPKCSGTEGCSQKCSQRLRQKREGNSGRRTCKGCRVEFWKKNSSRNAGRYCSRECAWKHDPYYNSDTWKLATGDGMLRWLNGWKKCKWCERWILNGGSYCDHNCAGHYRDGFFRECIRCGGQIDRRKRLSFRRC